MDDQQIPTLTDLADVLEAPSSTEPYRRHALPTVRWLIKQSPEAQALYDELHKDTGDRPSPMELAKLLCAIEAGAQFPEAQHTVRWLISQAEAAQGAYAELERMATDADDDLEWPSRVLTWHRQVDRLLEVDGWDDPAEIIDPTGDAGVNYAPLFKICTVRLARGEGDRRRLEAAVGKLERWVKVKRGLPLLIERARKVRHQLKDLGDPQSAADEMEKMAAALRLLDTVVEPGKGTEPDKE